MYCSWKHPSFPKILCVIPLFLSCVHARFSVQSGSLRHKGVANWLVSLLGLRFDLQKLEYHHTVRGSGKFTCILVTFYPWPPRGWTSQGKEILLYFSSHLFPLMRIVALTFNAFDAATIRQKKVNQGKNAVAIRTMLSPNPSCHVEKIRLLYIHTLKDTFVFQILNLNSLYIYRKFFNLCTFCPPKP